MRENMDKLLFGAIGSAVSSVGWSVVEVDKIVSIVCSVVGILITLITVLVIPLWKKIAEAKKDGKITPEEIEDITKTVGDGVKEVTDKIKEEGEKHGDQQ